MEQTKKRGEFLYKINEVVGSRIILKRYKENKIIYYDVKCLKDNNIDKITEFNLKSGHKCTVCTNQKILKGYNDIATTHKDSIKFFENIEDCYNYCTGSSKKVIMVCPNCGNKKLKQINIFFKNNYLDCVCRDNISFGEKLLFSIFKQLEVKFDYHKRDFKWLKKYKKEYDFYIPSVNCIIETHGRQHYIETKFSMKNNRSINKEQENDKLKEQLAKENGIEHYIVIDCSKSELEFVKKNVINSDLSNLFDLSEIDWNKCFEFTISTRIKEACNLWNNNVTSTVEIAKIMKMSKSTIQKYLKKGALLEWCEYDAKNIRKK